MVGLEEEKEKQREKSPETGGSSGTGWWGTEALNYRGIRASFGVNSALGAGKARQENEGGSLTRAPQGGHRAGRAVGGDRGQAGFALGWQQPGGLWMSLEGLLGIWGGFAFLHDQEKSSLRHSNPLYKHGGLFPAGLPLHFAPAALDVPNLNV